jgi:hypothetical protein
LHISKGNEDIFAKKYVFGRQLSCETFLQKKFFFPFLKKKSGHFFGKQKMDAFCVVFGYFEFFERKQEI